MLNWDEFQKQSSAQWMSSADKSSRGKYQAEALKYDVEGDFSVSVFVTERPDSTSPVDAAETASCVKILVTSAIEANELARTFLEYSPDAILFEIHGEVDLKVLLRDIYIDMISVFLEVHGDAQKVKEQVDEYICAHYTDRSVHLEVMGQGTIKLSSQMKFKERLNMFNLWSSRCNSGLILELEIKNDFIAQIAELRAMRRLWKKHGHQPENLTILAHCNATTDGDISPMIVESYQVLSTIMGGSDYVVTTFIEDKERTRLGINMMHIFRNESRMTQVIDTVAGAYLPEVLTEEMVHSVID
ncbi:MAG: hypothetical protein J5I52_02115 [Saprospiraceae bacterium]|nr:MAG: methylmalonyl-CoA mutase [Bacteroidetes bacterium OLB9]MCO6462922.1 hypothetical protein [Saprospiraceae bacterium]MCZ2337488.1 methylmalonyl-CoA mutase family protein [Chitinophagales bacterium]